MQKKIIKIYAYFTLVSVTLFAIPRLLNPIYSQFIVSNNVGSFSYYSTVERIREFALGGLCFFLTKQKPFKLSKLIKLLPLVLLFTLLLTLMLAFINLKLSTLIAVILTTLIIRFESVSLLPKYIGYPLEWLGERSYSIYYICHYYLLQNTLR